MVYGNVLLPNRGKIVAVLWQDCDGLLLCGGFICRTDMVKLRKKPNNKHKKNSDDSNNIKK